MATYPPLRARPAPALPVAQMVSGRPVHEVAEMLPRLFNLCRVAQGVAARAAFGLPLGDAWKAELRAEMVREHIVKLCLKWPAALNVPPVLLPRDWAQGDATAREAVFGPTRHMPKEPSQWSEFLSATSGIAPVLRAITDLFAPGVACRDALPFACADQLFHDVAQDNSVAARHVGHPVLEDIARQSGRGPLWAAAAVGFDLEALWNGMMPDMHVAPGFAAVPAARGLFGIKCTLAEGHVQSFARVTPTDHLLAPGGVLEQSLARLPAERAEALAGPLLSILDPCHPVTLEPVDVMEVAHA